MKKLIVGNWKMNGTADSVRTLIADVINGLYDQDALLKSRQIVICPSFLHTSIVRHALHGFPKIEFGVQDCSAFEVGAYTGDVSAKMCKDAGCSFVILGHSERRQHHGESDMLIAQKVKCALANDLKPIICVGETQAQRDSGLAQSVVLSQIEGSIPHLGPFDEIAVAYEPVWAIGTGKHATSADIELMHAFIRENLKSRVPAPEIVHILYGGSLKPENAAEILHLANVDGGLIGGASLKAADFLSIAKAAV